MGVVYKAQDLKLDRIVALLHETAIAYEIVNVVAAAGLSLEFGNRVVTSAIRAFFVFPRGSMN